MKVNFGIRFKSIKGDDLPIGDGNPQHLGEAAANALLAPDPTDRDFGVKATKYRLAMRVAAGGEVDVTPEEATMIKLAMGAIYVPLVCGQAESALNGDDPPRTKKVK